MNNVNTYIEQYMEKIFRFCLKPDGKLALIEMFFEHGCKTYDHLKSKGEIWASFETFTNFCEKIGFSCLDSEIINTRKGKISEGDLFPLDDNDCSIDRTIYLKKK